jgi:hypothetical protein
MIVEPSSKSVACDWNIPIIAQQDASVRYLRSI